MPVYAVARAAQRFSAGLPERRLKRREIVTTIRRKKIANRKLWPGSNAHKTGMNGALMKRKCSNPLFKQYPDGLDFSDKESEDQAGNGSNDCYQRKF
jgi:hypothetical protein